MHKIRQHCQLLFQFSKLNCITQFPLYNVAFDNTNIIQNFVHIVRPNLRWEIFCKFYCYLLNVDRKLFTSIWYILWVFCYIFIQNFVFDMFFFLALKRIECRWTKYITHRGWYKCNRSLYNSFEKWNNKKKNV